MGSVERRLCALIGDGARQSELISLRKGLFKHLMPPLTRREKRTKSANLETFEGFREALLAVLDTPEGVAAVVEVACANRIRDHERFALQAHVFAIG
jgi:hypothetical protein